MGYGVPERSRWPPMTSSTLTTHHSNPLAPTGGQIIPGVKRSGTVGVEVDTTPLDELDRVIQQLQTEARSDATRRAYAADWRRFRAWAEVHDVDGETIDPANVGRFLTAEALAGRALATIERRLGSLSALARRTGARSLYDDAELSELLAGLKKRANRNGKGRQTRATALTMERLAEVIPTIEGDSLASTRDRAILLIGWAALLRRSEIADLHRSDVTAADRSGWVDLTVRASKTSDEPETIAVGELKGYPDLCPVAALDRWLDAAGDTIGADGPLFPRITRGGRILTGDDGHAIPITGHAINAMVQRRTAPVAAASDNYSGHSLRRGGATSRAQRGATVIQLERAGRWSPGSTEVRKYIETVNRADDQGATLLDSPLPGLEAR